MAWPLGTYRLWLTFPTGVQVLKPVFSCSLQLKKTGVSSGNLLWLGLPTGVTHVITAESPLAGLTLSDMEAQDMEVLVLLDGIDATTSAAMQARCEKECGPTF